MRKIYLSIFRQKENKPNSNGAKGYGYASVSFSGISQLEKEILQHVPYRFCYVLTWFNECVENCGGI